jgi:hypothetical protein
MKIELLVCKLEHFLGQGPFQMVPPTLHFWAAFGNLKKICSEIFFRIELSTTKDFTLNAFTP